MADVIAMPRPNRTRADSGLDMPPCGNRWGPNNCEPAMGRPRRHHCWTWAGWPHVCRCLRCVVAP